MKSSANGRRRASKAAHFTPENADMFTGQRRAKITRLCACGCGRKFRTRNTARFYVNNVHKQRRYDRTH